MSMYRLHLQENRFWLIDRSIDLYLPLPELEAGPERDTHELQSDFGLVPRGPRPTVILARILRSRTINNQDGLLVTEILIPRFCLSDSIQNFSFLDFQS